MPESINTFNRPQQMEKILIATDLSATAESIVGSGLQLARKLQAPAELLTVINQYIDYVPPDTGTVFADQWEARTHIAITWLNQIKDFYPDLNINVQVFTGDPKEGILTRATQIQASLIVMGTHGRTGISHLLMGSTAEYVIRHTSIPVLVIPFNRSVH